MKNIAELHGELLSIGKRIAGSPRPNGCFIMPSYPTGDGSPHAEIVDGKYHYVQSERGSEFFRKVATSEDELLYWFTANSVWTMASGWELRHRQSGVDCRRLLFAKELELFAIVSESWASRKRQEQEHILEKHPFNDSSD